MIQVPHLAMPFRIVPGRGSPVTEQDSEEEILNCIEVILRYEKGFRPEKPDFGIDDQTFSREPNPVLIEQAISDWEPRIEMVVGQPALKKVDQLVTTLRVEKRKL